MNTKNKGFTLIELLVVISIIGVLSSVIFVSFSGSRDKARLAKAQNFDAQISHALGAYAVGIWRFEEGSGIDIHDESGFGNDGTFSGNPAPVFPAGVYSGTTALQFDGTDDYVNCGSNPSLNITDAITIEAWVNTNAFGTNQYRGIVSKEAPIITDGCRVGYGFVSSWGNGKDILFGLHMEGTGDCGNWVRGGIAVSLGQWYHVAGTYNSTTGEQKIYIDGSLRNTRSWTIGTKIRSSINTFLEIGKNHNGAWVFNGSIDNVSIYNEALSSAQIQQHFVAGAPAHGIAVNDN